MPIKVNTEKFDLVYVFYLRNLDFADGIKKHLIRESNPDATRIYYL